MAKDFFGKGGPTVDGTGMKSMKETSTEASVDGQASSGGPGGESMGGSHIQINGPNAAKAN